MSGNLTVNPLLKSLSPMAPGETTVPIAIDFVDVLAAGYTLASASVASLPSGFTFSTVTVSGTQVIFQATAPLTLGPYLLTITPVLTGPTPLPVLPRSVSALVLQM